MANNYFKILLYEVLFVVWWEGGSILRPSKRMWIYALEFLLCKTILTHFLCVFIIKLYYVIRFQSFYIDLTSVTKQWCKEHFFSLLFYVLQFPTLFNVHNFSSSELCSLRVAFKTFRIQSLKDLKEPFITESRSLEELRVRMNLEKLKMFFNHQSLTQFKVYCENIFLLLVVQIE